MHLTFDRNGDLGKMKGKVTHGSCRDSVAPSLFILPQVFTDRLAQALQRVPSDFASELHFDNSGTDVPCEKQSIQLCLLRTCSTWAGQDGEVGISNTCRPFSS